MPWLIALGIIYFMAVMLQSPEGRNTLGIIVLIIGGLLVLLSAGAGTWAHG